MPLERALLEARAKYDVTRALPASVVPVALLPRG